MTRRLTMFALLFLALVWGLAACGSDDHDSMSMDDDEMAVENGEMDGIAMGMNAALPTDLDTATTKESDNGAFVVSISTDRDPLPMNEIHNWVLHVETPDGATVDDATVSIDGGMPQHNHGYPTVPAITGALGNGDYQIEGVRFSMAGWWTMEFGIDAGETMDTVTFNVVLP